MSTEKITQAEQLSSFIDDAISEVSAAFFKANPTFNCTPSVFEKLDQANDLLDEALGLQNEHLEQLQEDNQPSLPFEAPQVCNDIITSMP